MDIHEIMDIHATFWHRAIFYMHKVPIVVDYCTKYEQSQPMLFCDITTNTYNLRIILP